MLSRRQRSLAESRMDIHKNARLTPPGRERLANMILSGQTPEATSQAAGVCPRTARKWVGRYSNEGLAGLQDRSSRPHRLRKPTPPDVIERIESLRRQRMPGKEIATALANLRQREQESEVGPIAIIAQDDATFEQAHQFAHVAQLVRPIRVFREWHERRRAIDRARAAE
jgi:transposase